MGARRFIWIGSGGLKLSKLDRFLVLRNFLDEWLEISTLVLEGEFLGHRLILMKSDPVDFGPIPFKLSTIRCSPQAFVVW